MQLSTGFLTTLIYALPLAAVVLLWATRSTLPRAVIYAALIALPFFYSGHYLLWQQMQGWPSDAELPPSFRLLGFEVREPDQKQAEAGQILLWVQDKESPQPRVHRLPYTKAMHRALMDAGEKAARGRTQIGQRIRSSPAQQPGAVSSPEAVVRFSDEQPPALPAKD